VDKVNGFKKSSQLGMPVGTATHRLRKLIMFELLVETHKNFCFQCGSEILSASEFSIEHKIPWLDSENPKELFFSLENISFSHLSCNSRVARRKCGLELSHGTLQAYQRIGCRCDDCKRAKSIENKRNR
jgi:hypothetical protein